MFAHALLAVCAMSVTVEIVFPRKQPLQPFSPKWGSPCGVVDDSGCVGGYPAIRAAMRNLSNGADGSIQLGWYSQIDRVIQGHPRNLLVNGDLWATSADALLLLEPYFLSWANRYEAARNLEDRNIPIVATNMKFDQGRIFSSTLDPYYFKEVYPGIRVGIVVLWPKDYWTPVHGALTTNEFVNLARSRNVSTVIGVVPTFAREETIPDLLAVNVDVLTYYNDNVTSVDIRKSGSTWVVQFPDDTDMFVSSLGLDFSPSMSLTNVRGSYQHVALPGYPAVKDMAYQEDVSRLQQIVDVVQNQDAKVGVSTIDMPFGRIKAEGIDRCRHEECELGTLSCAALLNARPSDDISFVNGGALRSGWPKGDIMKSHLTDAFPFQNYICFVNLTGAEVIRTLEHSAAVILPSGMVNLTASKSGRFLQTGGLQYDINPTLPPYNRITGVRTKVSDAWVPLQMRRVYRVVTSSYICNKGDGFSIKGHKDSMSATQTDMWAMIMRYVGDFSPITPEKTGSIRYTFDSPPIGIIRTAGMCSATETFAAEWEVCDSCGIDEVAENNVCVDVPKDFDATPIIIALTCFIVVVIIVVAVVFVMLSKKKKEAQIKFAPKDENEPVVICFTDIKKSTELWSEYQKEMEVALKLHHRICRDLIESSSGYEVKTIGDAFMVAFGCPIKAVDFLCELQLELLAADWPQELMMHPACREETGFKGLRVRAGAHLGYVTIRETPTGGYDYEGQTSNLSARVSDSGDGGQVVITESLYREVEAALDSIACVPDVKFLGSFAFKGVAQEVPCYQILPEDIANRKFDDLRNVVKSEPEKHQLTLDEPAVECGKTKMITSMQLLRKWISRMPGGVTVKAFSNLLCDAAGSDRVIINTVVNAILVQVSRLTQRPDLREDAGGASGGGMARMQSRKNLRGDRGDAASTAKSSIDAKTDVTSKYEGASHGTTLKWPAVSEILRSLPPAFVASLESFLIASKEKHLEASGGTHRLSATSPPSSPHPLGTNVSPVNPVL